MRTVRDASWVPGAMAVAVVALMAARAALAQPAPPEPPASAASGPTEAELVCKRRPQLCAALHRANQALLDAEKANRKGQYVCTSLNHQPGCGSTPPKAYWAPKGNAPYGNPGDVAEGRRLLDWYLKNLSCEALCQPEADAQACERACNEGRGPKDPPATGGATPKPAKASPLP